MIKKLLISAVASAFVCSTALATLQPVQLMNKKPIREVFNSSTEETFNSIKQQKPVLKTTASDTEIYFEDFEVFEGETLMPYDWIAIDETLDGGVYCTNVLESTQGYFGAFSGDNCLSSMFNDEAPRNGWAISSGVELEAGHTYHFGIYAFCMGYNGVADEWRLTIGNAQTVAAQTNVIIDKTGANATFDTNWTLCTGTFTPTEKGVYYVGINHCTPVAGVNIALWDYLQIDSDHVRIYPDGAMFSVGGLWSLDGHTMDENGNVDIYRLYIAEGDSLKYGYTATNCESVEWDFGSYAVTPDLTAERPIVKYDFSKAKSDEIYNDVFLTMINADGSTDALREFFVNRINHKSDFTDFVGNFCPEDGFYKYTAPGGSDYDALSGINSNYTRIAECFRLPENTSVTIAGAYVIPVQYTISIINKNKEFTARILKADENGLPGEAVYSQNFKFSEVFGSSNFEGTALAAVEFSQEIDVQGTFFFEFEFPSGLKIGSNNNIFFATNRGHIYSSGNTTYYYNEVGTTDRPTGWLKALNYYGASISTAIYPLVTFNGDAAVSNLQVNKCTVYANGNEVSVVNAPYGSDIIITDIAGRIVMSEKSDNIKTNIQTGLNAGIYIVTVNGESTKIAIR